MKFVQKKNISGGSNPIFSEYTLKIIILINFPEMIQ